MSTTVHLIWNSIDNHTKGLFDRAKRTGIINVYSNYVFAYVAFLMNRKSTMN